jgi:two-component system chemotaxis sensor kinase CheA
MDDEVLLIFLEESREHLEGIEDDLLAIEEGGAHVDHELVNKVFRAIHTVKGGSGFFALDAIKNLAHVMESVLDLIRKDRLIPTKPIMNVLLGGSDLLKAMINDPEHMNQVDATQAIHQLEHIKNGTFGQEEAGAPSAADTRPPVTLLPIKNPAGKLIFEVSEEELLAGQKEEKGGNLVFLAEFDLIDDVERKGKTPWDLLKEVLTLTYFVDSKVDFEAVGSLDQASGKMRIPFYVLLTTVMDKSLLCYFLGLSEDRVFQVAFNETPGSKPSVSYTPSTVEEHQSNLTAADISTLTLTPSPQVVAPSPPPPAPPKETPKPVAPKAPSTPDAPSSRVSEGDSSGGADSKFEKKSKPDGSIRVNVKILDKLMTLAGELVLTRNQLIQNSNDENIQGVQAAAQGIDHLTTELQDAIMATRMQSIGIVFNKFKRIVRDMSQDLGKKINLNLEGEDVELDRTIIESVGDPLTHLVRNSVDHGIETPEERVAAGKPATGNLLLKASHEAGFVVIDIIDDGRGVNIARVREKALETGIVTNKELEQMSQKELVNLIFRPGFSTAKKVSDVSGRGVGMDVVKTNITELGGVVDLETKQGEGTKMQIKLPLTLAILPSLLVDVEGSRFAIPQASLMELVRITARDVKNRIERIGDAPVIRLRGELLPLVDMKDVLGITMGTFINEKGERIPDRRQNIADRRSTTYTPEGEKLKEEETEAHRRERGDRRSSPRSAINIAVVHAGDMKIGLIVDHLLDSSEIVVKPLGSHLKGTKIYAGATILGDGWVALILDVFGIRQFMRLDHLGLHQKAKRIEEENRRNQLKDTHELLILENGENEFFAVPLDLVLRIEKIKTSDIETTGGQKAIRYRGGSLGLFAIEDVANVKHRKDSDEANIVVFKVANREVGILVKQVIDIIQTNAEIDGVTHKQIGIFGSAIIRDRITLFLDVFGVVSTAAPQWFQEKQLREEKKEELKSKNLLLVEDSRFFLAQISEFLFEAGYNVITAMDGVEGLETLEKRKDEIDLVITDIEMPNMDGFELTETIRSRPEYNDLPVVAVTSVSGRSARERGRAVGIDAYLIKLDREEILEQVKQFLIHGRSFAHAKF